MNLIGVGLYTFQEAARLTGTSAQDLRRWLKGRAYNAPTSGKHTIPPLWRTELAESELDAVSFHDLLEIRFVKAFRKSGVSTPTIRLACENARHLFDHPYPDNNLPQSLAHALHALSQPSDHSVCHLRDYYPPNTTDIEWIESLVPQVQ